jgi:molybdopterin synthase sulfur carrier subunit
MAPSSTLTLKYFASVREAIGCGSETWQSGAGTVAALRDELIARGEPYATALARGRAVRVALNQRMAQETEALPAAAEVAFFPPVTGG